MSRSADPTPYDKYLEDNHFLTRSLPIDDKRTHQLVVKWYLPGESEPEVHLTRLINLNLSGNVSTQDTIQIGRDNGYVELSAEFDADGKLLKSPEYEDNKYFKEIVEKMDEIRKKDGSRLSLSFNHSEQHFLYSHDGEWLQRQNGEGGIPALKDGGRLI